MNTSVTLRAHNLVKSLGRRTVVDRLCLHVKQGEVVGLLGPNGAGKTTVFQMLMGILPPDAGQVLLEDPPNPTLDLGGLPIHARARHGVGYLPQQTSIFSGLSVARNVEAVLQLHHQPREQVTSLLQEFGLLPLARQQAASLSGGERRRLELARLLAADPLILLLDEPFKALDPQAVDQLAGRLAALAQRGIGILITDHNVHQALTICCRAYILVGGRVMVSGSPKEVTEDPEARRAFWAWAPGPIAGGKEWHSS